MRAMSMDAMTDRSQPEPMVEARLDVGAGVADRKVKQRPRNLKTVRVHRLQALAANRRQDDFLAVILHGLRAPLMDMCRAAYERGTRNEWPEAELAARLQIERQAGRVTRLVVDLLELSRLASGQARLEREQLDLRDVVRRAMATVESIVFARQQRLVAWLPDEPILLHADRGRLERVFVNLLLNAARFSDDGSEIIVCGQQERDQAIVRVCDRGAGIAPGLLPRIFDLFMRADRSASPGEAGLGIGLTLARGFVEIHGGNLHAASDGAGLGSEFTVRLPIG